MTDNLPQHALTKVSILIPTYNQAAYIEANVRSAQSQTYPNLEIIIADNVSTDATEALVRPLLADPRLRYHRNATNLGRVGNYRNLVHTLATGELVLVLDGDDVLTNSDYIAHAVDLMTSDPAIVLVFGKVLQGTSPEAATEQNAGTGLPRVSDGTAFFLSHPPYGTIGLFHLSTLYRREAALAIDIYDRDLLSVDYDAFYRMILGRKLGFLDEVAGLWRQHGHNTSQTYNFSALLANFDALTRPYEHARKLGAAPARALSRWLRLACGAYGLICLKAAVRRGRFADAARFVRRIIEIDPIIVPQAMGLAITRVWPSRGSGRGRIPAEPPVAADSASTR